MTEQAQAQTQDSEIIDLGFDVTEADVQRPVLANGTYPMQIAFVRREQSKEKNLPMLVVGFKTTQPAKDTNGKEINPGFTVTQRYLMQPVGKMTQEMINERFQRVHFAAAGPGRVNTGEWVGKTVNVRLKIREPKDGYAASNEVDAVNPFHG